MRVLRILSIISAILSIILFISTIMIWEINRFESNRIIFPDYAMTVRRIKDYKFPNRYYRFTAECICEYKIKKWMVSSMTVDSTINDIPSPAKLSDYALYLIMTTSILTTNINYLQIANHPRFVKCTNGYDSSSKTFDSDSIKSDVIDILSKVDNKTDYTLFDDQMLYNRLIGV